MANTSINIHKIENLKISIIGRKLQSNKKGVELKLSKNQITLLNCLNKNIHENGVLTSMIWGEENDKSKRNNFNQLIYQLRKSLVQKGFPEDVILTIPRYGYCLNRNYLREQNSISYNKNDILIDY